MEGLKVSKEIKYYSRWKEQDDDNDEMSKITVAK